MKTIKYILTSLLTLSLLSPAIAQEPEPASEGTAKVKIIKNINGEVTVIEKEVPISHKNEIDEMLRDLNISEDLGDEDIEIIIRQGKRAQPMEQWMERFSEQHDRAFLGVYVGSTVEKVVTDEDGTDQTVITDGDGRARISGIVQGSAAEAAGLQKGDVITSIGEFPITDYKALVDVLAKHGPGDVVTVGIERDGAAQSVQATLGKRKMPSRMMHHFMDPGMWNEHREMRRHDFDPDKGFLGVHIRNREEGDGDKGVIVTSVVDNSAAAELGLKEGDIIFEVNDVAVNTTEELRSVVGLSKAGDQVKVEYMRDGKKTKGTAELKKRERTSWSYNMDEAHAEVMQSLEGIKWDESKQCFDREKFEQHFQDLEERLGNRTFDFHMDALPGSRHDRIISIMIRVDGISEADQQMLKQSNPGLELNSNLDVDHLKFSPNPSGGQFDLSFELGSTDPVQVRIFDPSGREVFTQRVDDFKGSYENRIDITGNPDGVYFLVVEQGSKSFSRKVVIQ